MHTLIDKCASEFYLRIKARNKLYLILKIAEDKFSCIQYANKKAQRFVRDDALFQQFAIGVYNNSITREEILEDLKAA